MSKKLRTFIHNLTDHTTFDTYYASVVRTGRLGVPTADEAKRDLALSHLNIVRLGGF